MVRSQPSENILELSVTHFARRRGLGKLPEVVDLSVMAGSGQLRHCSRETKEEIYSRAISTDFTDPKLKLGQRVLVKLLLLMVAWHNSAEYPLQDAEAERLRDCSQCALEFAQALSSHDVIAAFWWVESIVPYLRSIVAEAVAQLSEDPTATES